MTLPPGMINWALLVEYDGGPFAGWQRQDTVLTVQQVLEDAAAQLTGHPSPSAAAGRTDSGVHASGQVAMLALPERMGPRQVRDAINFFMRPHPVVVLQAAPVAPDWNPRFSAIGRSYRYRILNRRARPVLLSGRVWHWPHPLDVAAMQAAATRLLGRHDFTSFRAAACQANSPLRTLDRFDVTQAGDMIEFAAEARSFLHHQVRTMVGTVVQVGTGRWQAHDVSTILDARDRAAAGPNAPPQGLTLVGVRYPVDPFANVDQP